MFNENFSFRGSSPHPPSLPVNIEEWTSAEISPFTSRCSSPHSSRTASTRRDSRFDAYRNAGAPRHPSITALTAQLQSQALNDSESRSPSPSPSDVTSPADSSLETDADEGFYDGPDTPATTLSDFSYDSNDVDPTLWDLSMSDTMVATSSPRPSLSLEAQALSSYTMRRKQRQALVRLQCLVSRTPDLAMLIEECHPSSLPLETDKARAYSPKGRSGSTGSTSGWGLVNGTNNGRTLKERNGSVAAVRKAPRMRKRTR
ncbi:uncharacterized protein Z518_02035 [Rhinocladiella mackenziei CBS 650.93]|uniref:Rhinocladiella mackenziei CBS 650.93 unplaced genomic scaffold supercont1.2, whole genome shotgun sequence n=1 Tax=Rhinocladiella mackenziei CBS 650.93 TaxID=1442369 RepID=A0A0D2FYJ0_9EURO|nr:uncharacterized protein Z518_02035 [Rhinocladiella mackenziei CBS 650.93]KIX07382.1 hypothetical protein Z518_02035 [Rhinocladiella mackenziei CBS 650.93]